MKVKILLMVRVYCAKANLIILGGVVNGQV